MLLRTNGKKVKFACNVNIFILFSSSVEGEYNGNSPWHQGSLPSDNGHPVHHAR